MSKSAGILVVAYWAMVSLVSSTETGYAQGDDKSRLGETVAQCDQRYGTPTEIASNKTMAGAMYRQVTCTVRSYERDGIHIALTFVAGRAVCIYYKASSGSFSEQKIAKLVAINKYGRNWTRQPVQGVFGDLEFYSSDGGRIQIARYVNDSGNKENSINVCSPDALTPEMIEKHKALFRKYNTPITTESVDGL